MIKFKPQNKGNINQFWYGTPEYFQYTGHRHSGIDTYKGYGKDWRCDNEMYVYKVFSDKLDNVNPASNWQGVYGLVPWGENFMEVASGHFSETFVKEGEWVPEGWLIGREGNRGEVYQGGVRITPEMQRNGDKRGTHTHTSYRPVKPVTEQKQDKHYLNNSDGTKFKWHGKYMEVINTNETHGTIDPMPFSYKNSIQEDVAMVTKITQHILEQYGFII